MSLWDAERGYVPINVDGQYHQDMCEGHVVRGYRPGLWFSTGWYCITRYRNAANNVVACKASETDPLWGLDDDAVRHGGAVDQEGTWATQ